jgi:hypothetical protein
MQWILHPGLGVDTISLTAADLLSPISGSLITGGIVLKKKGHCKIHRVEDIMARN